MNAAKKWDIEIHRHLTWSDTCALEQNAIERVQNKKSVGVLLLMETAPTLTYGSSASSEDLITKDLNSIPQVKAPRGGKWTYHGPGQIILFPIFQLKDLGYSTRDVRAFLCDFQKAMIESLEEIGIQSHRDEDRPFGLYFEGKKICSFGISVSRGLVSHGAALYLTPQQDGFSKINPCGVVGEQIGSLDEWHPGLSWEKIAFQLVETFKKSFRFAIA